MNDQSMSMPHRSVDEDAAAPGGRPGSQAGGDWANHRPSAAELAEHLGGMQFPISKADLVQNIRWQKAPLPVIYFVERLPEKEYRDADEIVRARWKRFRNQISLGPANWKRSLGTCKRRLTGPGDV